MLHTQASVCCKRICTLHSHTINVIRFSVAKTLRLLWQQANGFLQAPDSCSNLKKNFAHRFSDSGLYCFHYVYVSRSCAGSLCIVIHMGFAAVYGCLGDYAAGMSVPLKLGRGEDFANRLHCKAEAYREYCNIWFFFVYNHRYTNKMPNFNESSIKKKLKFIFCN